MQGEPHRFERRRVAPTHFSGLTARARRSLRRGFGAAIAVFACSIAGCGDSVEDHLEKVRALQAEGDMERSIPLLIELIESGQRQGEILYRYGRALSLTGKPERSVWALDAARDDPEWFVRASQQLAIDAHLGGNFEFAREIFERLHEEAPEAIEDDRMAMLLEARILLDSQNRFEEALERIEEILERFPEDETAVRMKAVALLGLRKPDEAYEFLRASGVAPLEEGGGSDGDAAGKDGGKASNTELADGEAKEANEEGEGTTEDDEDPGIYLEVDDESREAYWCAVRTSFKHEAEELDEAAKIVEACLETHPSSADLVTQAVKLYSDMDRPERILEVLEKAYEASPEDAQVRGAYVQYLERLDRHDEVEKVLRKSIDEAIAAGGGATLETAQQWIDLAGFLMNRDRVGEALVAFEKANEIIGDNASPDLLLREAEALIRAKEWDEALAMAAKTPVEVHRQMLQGRIAFERGDYQKALDVLGEAALVWPDNAPIRYYRARAAEGVGQFDLAVEEYRHAVRSDSTLAAARERLARLHLAEDQPREASGILAFQSPRKPSTPSTAMRILMVEVDARRGSEPDLNIPASDDYPPTRVRVETIQALARGLSRRTNARIAAGVLSEFEKESIPALRGAFLRERVELLIQADEIDSAVSEARLGVKARPDDLDGRVALGIALAAQGGADEEATRLLSAAVEEKADDVDALVALAEVEARSGRAPRADELLERALRTQPDRWSALEPQIRRMIAAGKKAEAIRRLEEFVALEGVYDGKAALLLARELPDDDSTKERRIALVRRSIRFGGGTDALEFMVSLDPEVAAQYEVRTSAPAAAPAPTSAPTNEAPDQASGEAPAPPPAQTARTAERAE